MRVLALVRVVSQGPGGASQYVQIRKKRNVRRVMGWLLSRQLSDPTAGACCALSMLCVG
jgi:hypothetical protein